MGLFSKLTSGGLMNEIRCDEPSYLIWKWRPAGGNGKRENAIRWGSSLRVKDGEVAVFVYKHSDGTLQDFIEGPFDGIADTKNLPRFISSILLVSFRHGSQFRTSKLQIQDSRISVFRSRCEEQLDSRSRTTGSSSSCIGWRSSRWRISRSRFVMQSAAIQRILWRTSRLRKTSRLFSWIEKQI